MTSQLHDEVASSLLTTVCSFIFSNLSDVFCFIHNLVRAYSGVFAHISNVNDLNYYTSSDIFLPLRVFEVLQIVRLYHFYS